MQVLLLQVAAAGSSLEELKASVASHVRAVSVGSFSSIAMSSLYTGLLILAFAGIAYLLSMMCASSGKADMEKAERISNLTTVPIAELKGASGQEVAVEGYLHTSEPLIIPSPDGKSSSVSALAHTWKETLIYEKKVKVRALKSLQVTSRVLMP